MRMYRIDYCFYLVLNIYILDLLYINIWITSDSSWVNADVQDWLLLLLHNNIYILDLTYINLWMTPDLPWVIEDVQD